MPFEAFLSETHARPTRASRFGFMASIAVHGPPITIFVTTWLTHAMLIGSSGQLPDQPTRGTYYIPISVYGQGPGSGGTGPTATASGGTSTPGTRPRVGLTGRSGRAGRRGLVAPREIKRLPAKATPWNDPFMLGSYASNDLHGAVGQTSGSGDDQPGTGNGSGSGGQGIGGGAGIGGRGGAGNGMLPTALERARSKETKPSANRGQAHKATERPADGEEDLPIGTDLEIVEDDGRAMRAAYISQDSAAYYRTHDDMPGLPAWLAGHREYSMLFRICVSTEGTVSNVVVLKSANADADQVLCTAIEKWRYRPRIVDGVARPFCHPIRIVYSRP
jgi:hypothetical protein